MIARQIDPPPRPNSTHHADKLSVRNSAFLVVGVVATIAVLIVGCTTPIGTQRVSQRTVYKHIYHSALNSRGYSDYTQQVLARHDLVGPAEDDLAQALVKLHGVVETDGRRDGLFALAELSFLHGERLRRSVKPGVPRRAPDAYLSAAIYAFLYLLASEPGEPPDPFARNFRMAADLYNRALAQALVDAPGTNSVVKLRGGNRHLLPGNVEVEFRNLTGLDLDQFDRFLPADEFQVRGLSTRNRDAGLGAPLIAAGKRTNGHRYPMQSAAVAFLRVNGGLREWSEGQLTATLELHVTRDRSTVEVNGRRIPLEGDTTAPVAFGLNNKQLWKLGRLQFFSFEEIIDSDIYSSQPFVADKIPVIFVHGTFSSPVWWAEMINTLSSDPTLRRKYQSWFYIYNSGNPISYSASNLRDSITTILNTLDPRGTNTLLHQMVVIGHSQGGLLTKLTATDTGDALWRASLGSDFDFASLSPDDLDALRSNFSFDALPSVSRVVFISTPHRGSYLSTRFVRGLARWFISLPGDIVDVSTSLVQGSQESVTVKRARAQVPTSLDGMSPKNPWLLALADIPVTDRVRAHSIIALKGDDEPPDGSDGVVKYTSAHVDYVESEYIVRSSHSCQDKPAAIEEVRRILLEHLRNREEVARPRLNRDQADGPQTRTKITQKHTPGPGMASAGVIH